MSTRNYPNLAGTPVNANNGICTITIPGQTNPAGARVELINVTAGYDAKPSSAKLLTITRGASVKIFEIPITEAGPAPIDVQGYMSGPGEQIVITLAASGTGGITGYLNACAKVI